MFGFIALLALTATGPRPSELKVFKDWIVGCDNALFCEAIALVPDDGWDKKYRALSIARGPEPAAPIYVTGSDDPETGETSWAGDRELRFKIIGDTDELGLHQVQPLIDVIRAAEAIEMRDSKSRVVGRISLQGASAALLYNDDMQRRVGTVTALVRRGTRPASSIPTPPLPALLPPLPPIEGKPLTASIAELRKLQKGCDLSDAPPTFLAIGRGQTLALVRCFLRGWNEASTPIVIEMKGGKKTIEVAEFDFPPSDTLNGDTLLINADWSTSSRLSTFAWGRETGDCGRNNTYVWDGTRFRLEHREEMTECRGSIKFITTYQAMSVD